MHCSIRIHGINYSGEIHLRFLRENEWAVLSNAPSTKDTQIETKPELWTVPPIKTTWKKQPKAFCFDPPTHTG